MAIIDLGKVSITWRGTYAGGTAYTPKDAVVYNNASYICIANTTGNLPTDTAYWNVMAAKGVDGTDLTTTLTTQGDIVYRDGSGLQRLAAGTSGQFLKTQGSGANPIWGTVSTTGLVKQVSHVQDTTNYSHANSGFTNFGSGMTYTPLTTTSRVMAWVEANIHVEQDGTDNDVRSNIRIGTDNSSGTTIYENSSDVDNIGHVNMLAAGHGWRAVITTVISSCQRNGANNVIVKIGGVSNIDAGTTVFCYNQRAVFMEIE